jgi:single-strand DNA-binding protein
MLPQASIVGNITNDPQIKFTQSEEPIITFSVACNKQVQNQETKEWETLQTAYVNVIVFGSLAETITNLIDNNVNFKGLRVEVEGEMTSQAWVGKDDGVAKSSLNLKAKSITIPIQSITKILDLERVVQHEMMPY